MRQQKNISIPKPCSENWDNMSLADKGRYCAVCSKTVIDFTTMSDGEILDIFKKAQDTPVCGHFFETQLNRSLIDTRYKPSYASSLIKKAAAMIILAQSLAVIALAQQVKKLTLVTQQPKKKGTTSSSGLLQIKGRVIDGSTNKPVTNLNIQVKGTSLSAATDSVGHFSITLPHGFIDSIVVLTTPVTLSANLADEVVTLNDIKSGKQITMFLLPAQTMPIVSVTTYDVRPITYGGAAIQTVTTQKVYFTQRFARHFKRKKHKHE